MKGFHEDGTPAADPAPSVLGRARQLWRQLQRHRRAIAGESLEHPTRTAIAYGDAFRDLVHEIQRTRDVTSRIARAARRVMCVAELEQQYRLLGHEDRRRGHHCADRIRDLADRKDREWAVLLQEIEHTPGLAWAA